MQQTKSERRSGTTAFGQAISTLFERTKFMFTWKRREKRLNIYIPCYRPCIFCKYYVRHLNELEWFENEFSINLTNPKVKKR